MEELIDRMESWLPCQVRHLFDSVPELRNACVVGGSVRDALLGLGAKDVDIEVYGVDYPGLLRALNRVHPGSCELVGRAFGVVKIRLSGGVEVDLSLPRRDSKVGPGHKGFVVSFDPGVHPRDAALRRDFTINSMMYFPGTKRFLDYFNGREDLQRGVLRHTSPAFSEDPLRVLRGMQFAGRFRLKAAPETLSMCRSIRDGIKELAVERIREEWLKWATASSLPSAGLRFLRDCGWMDHHPELKVLETVPQDPEWHPEGDVMAHTGHACDALAGLADWRSGAAEFRAVTMFAVLTHDFGKARTTQVVRRDGRDRIVSPGHEHGGMADARAFFDRIGLTTGMRERIEPLVANHMVHLQSVSDRSIRRLSKRLEPESIETLCLVMTADAMGRPPRPAEVPRQVRQLLEKAAALSVQVEPPKPLVMGRDLIAAGLEPGPRFGGILRAAYEAQLDGEFLGRAEALAWLSTRLSKGFDSPPD